MCSIWNVSFLAPEERVTPDGYHVWNWNLRGTGSEKKQARHTGRLAEHLTYLPGDKIKPPSRRGRQGIDNKGQVGTEFTKDPRQVRAPQGLS